MVAVNSSAISDVIYDGRTWTMTVRFHSGREYTYCDVPKNIFEEFIESESIGKHFNQHIKGRFPRFS